MTYWFIKSQMYSLFNLARITEFVLHIFPFISFVDGLCEMTIQYLPHTCYSQSAVCFQISNRPTQTVDLKRRTHGTTTTPSCRTPLFQRHAFVWIKSKRMNTRCLVWNTVWFCVFTHSFDQQVRLVLQHTDIILGNWWKYIHLIDSSIIHTVKSSTKIKATSCHWLCTLYLYRHFSWKYCLVGKYVESFVCVSLLYFI